MKKVEVSKRIVIEFTDKELVSILTCLDEYFEDLDEYFERNKDCAMTEDRKQEVNTARNLVGIMKRWI